MCLGLLISSMCVLSKAQAKDTFLDLVPSETPYFVNYKLNSQLLSMVPKQLPKLESRLSETAPARKKLITLLLNDFISHYNEQKLAKLGLRNLKDFHIGIYGLGLWPVVNFTVKDQAQFTRWLVRNTKKAGIQVSKAGNSLKFEVSSKFSLILSYVSKSWLNLALVPKLFTSDMLPYLKGVKKPKSNVVNSGKMASWAKEIEVSSDFLFWIDFENIIQTLLNHGQGLNKRFAWFDDQITRATPSSCINDYLELAKALPYSISGTDKSELSTIKAKSLQRFAPEVAEVTQTFSAQSAYTLTSEDHLIQLSFALNTKAIIEGLKKAFQAKVKKPFICPNLLKVGLGPQKLQMLNSQLMMVRPFIYDLIGLSVLVKSISPPRAQLVINAKNVINLVGLAKLNPRLAQIKLPDVGAPAETLHGLPIPPAYKIMAQLRQNTLGLSLGDGEAEDLKAVLDAKPSEQPAIFSISYNLDGIFKLLQEFIDNVQQMQRKVKEINYKHDLEQAKSNGTPLPSPPKFEDKPNPLDSLGAIMKGMLSLTLRFDARGLLFESKMRGNNKP